jgi:glycosidase
MKQLIRLVSACMVLALPVHAQTTKEPAKTPLFDRPITDEVFYFLVTDRFADGDRNNNKAYDSVPVDQKDKKLDIIRHGYDPTQDNFYQGGDFQGIIQKLDYLQGLGISSIWLSPIMKNRSTQVGSGPLGVIGGYHGYWPIDFTTVDPHWGKEEDFKALIAAAHQRGIKIFIDVITNHTADVISYRECGDCPYRSVADYPYATTRKGRKLNEGFVHGDLSEANFAKFKDPDYAYTPFLFDPKLRKVPDWLNDFTLYHNRGNSTFSGENSEKGDFYGLDDLMTENPKVVKGMIDIYADWIRKYKFDGFRVDTVKHVNIEFWQQFVPAIRQAAKEAGVPHFFIFGEVFDSNPKVLSRYTRRGKMDSVLDFNLQSSIRGVFADSQDPEKLHETMAADDLYRLAHSPQSMMTFLSNHDIGRLALSIRNRYKDASDEELIKRTALAHAYLFFARGVPVLYYGDEQGFVGYGDDRGARETMFASQAATYTALKNLGGKSPAVDNYDSKHPLYQAIAQMSKVYKAHPLLRSGEYDPVRDLGPGVFAFRRTSFESAEEYIVAFNFDAQKPLAIKWTRPGFTQVFPEGSGQLASTLELAPLSYAIVKGPKAKETNRNLGQISFANLAEGERVADLFYAELNLPVGQDFKVSFSTKTSQDKDFKPLYVDSNAPYRAYIDGVDYPNGTELTLQAEVLSKSGQKRVASRKLVIDARPPLVTVQYENGNLRKEAFLIGQAGRITPPTPLTEGRQYQFAWPLGETSQTVFFASALDSDGENWAYDRPVVLDYKQHVLPHLTKGPNGEPLVTIFVNNRHEVSFDALKSASSDKPATLPTKADAAAPFGRKAMFLRGGMNGWQANDGMEYEGAFTYRTTVKLDSGRVEFKFADKDWTADQNFGGPFAEEGLTASGRSGNLSLEIPKGKDGRYVFDLIHIPAQELGGGKPLTFYRVNLAR